jgi:hypothetical protein
MRRSPGFTVVAIASLAIGIGFNTALFSVIDALLLRPLPVERPDQIVDVYTKGGDGDTYATTSYPDFLDFQAQNRVFASMLGYSPAIAAVKTGDQSHMALGEVVTDLPVYTSQADNSSRWARLRRIAAGDALHPVQQAWIDQQVPQCGFCQNGMMIKAVELLEANPSPTVTDIKGAFMSGASPHLCRCGSYTAILDAVRHASTLIAKERGTR